MGTLTVHLVRHAPVHPLRRDTVYGLDAEIIDITNDKDPAVTAAEREGLAQKFANLAALLPERAAVAVSNARRTQQTAEAVRARQVAPSPFVLKLASMTEQQWGDWTDMPHNILEMRDPDFVQLRQKKPGWERIKPPAHATNWLSETFNQFTARVWQGFQHLPRVQALQGKDELVIFTHGGVVRAAHLLFGGITPDQAVQIKVPHLSVTSLQLDLATASWRLMNQTTAITP